MCKFQATQLFNKIVNKHNKLTLNFRYIKNIKINKYNLTDLCLNVYFCFNRKKKKCLKI